MLFPLLGIYHQLSVSTKGLVRSGTFTKLFQSLCLRDPGLLLETLL